MRSRRSWLKGSSSSGRPVSFWTNNSGSISFVRAASECRHWTGTRWTFASMAKWPSRLGDKRVTPHSKVNPPLARYGLRRWQSAQEAIGVSSDCT